MEINGLDTSRSNALFQRMQRTMPAGDTRTSVHYEPYPLALSRGEGYRVWDVDGNEFIDLVNNFTSLVHGHAAPAIVEALRAQAELGTSFSAPVEAQAELAERICARITSIERLRFTNSGTEANMMAIRAARAFTGRDRIVKADGGFHGTWDQVPMTTGDGHGVPQAVTDMVQLVPYNDSDRLAAAMDEHGSRIAAIVLEPVLGGGGVIAGSREYFRLASDLAARHGALLIADEVISARLRIGGYQSELNVVPDLTVLGKIIGGGLPVGAFGGRADVMEMFSPHRKPSISHGGTFNGNPMTMRAGCVSLDMLTASEIDRINHLGERLAQQLQDACETAGFQATLTVCGSILQVHASTVGPILAWQDVNLSDPWLARLHLAGLAEGLFLSRRGMMSISTPMDDAVIDSISVRWSAAVERVVAEQLSSRLSRAAASG